MRPPPDLQSEVSNLVAEYIHAQGRRSRPYAVPLTPAQRGSMDGFYSPELLDSTRLLVLGEQRLENPSSYKKLREWGFTNLPDFSGVVAITLSDVIVSHIPFTDGLLFHELVHAEQYRQLGIFQFAEMYVRGFLSGNGYDGIPLEHQAYELGGRFEQAPSVRFSVEDEVRSWLQGLGGVTLRPQTSEAQELVETEGYYLYRGRHYTENMYHIRATGLVSPEHLHTYFCPWYPVFQACSEFGDASLKACLDVWHTVIIPETRAESGLKFEYTITTQEGVTMIDIVDRRYSDEVIRFDRRYKKPVRLKNGWRRR